MVPRLSFAILAVVLACEAKTYNLLRYNGGQTFFDAFQFDGTYDTALNSPTPDFLNSGDNFFANRSYAMSAGLTSVNDKGHAIIKVDDTSTVVFNEKRFSVGMNTTELYGPGNLFVFDAIHIPFGCSVWPSYWFSARNWPQGGEIDVLEQVNQETNNKMALHTSSGCTVSNSAQGMTGEVLLEDCADAANAGCIIRDPRATSFGTGFNNNGGGVWVTEFATTGISIWFFPRPEVPATLSTSSNSSSIDTATLGEPVALYSASTCDIASHFEPQSIVLQIVLCGTYGRSTFNATCPATRDNACYLDWVIGPPGNYTNAYFEIASLRVFNDGSPNSFSGPVVAPGATDDHPTGGNTGNNGGGGNQGGGGGDAALRGFELSSTVASLALLIAALYAL